MLLFRTLRRSFADKKKIVIFGKQPEGKTRRKQLNEQKRQTNEEKKNIFFQSVKQEYKEHKTANDIHPESESKGETKGEDVHFLRYQEIYQEYEKKQALDKKEYDRYKSYFESPEEGCTQLSLDSLNIVNIENREQMHKIPTLLHGLDKVVERPGVYSIEEISKLQPDGGKFLSSIYQPEEIDFNAIPRYVPPSQDALLRKFARESKIKYIMSTSTISQVLSQIYYIVCRFKKPNFDQISERYEAEPRNYMISQRKPVTNILRKVDDGIYAFDSDKGVFQYPNLILMDLGKVSERQFTLSSEEFRKMLLKEGHADKLPNQGKEGLEEDYHRFMRLNDDICIRSQIDTKQVDKDGKTHIFEIKTRACAPMRYDIHNYLDYSDYSIESHRGLHSSFEREYYDLIRGAFLKYSFQLKVGNMDGVFFAYHNTINNFGFEYVSAPEIYKRVFGSVQFSDVCFMTCSKILTNTLDLILQDLEGQKYEMLKIGFFSCCIKQRLICFVELLEEHTEWSEEGLIAPSEEVADEYDYYTKVSPMKNKVFKYETSIFTYVNGVYMHNEIYDFQPDDQLDIKYKFNPLGEADFKDYMSFLHDSYKFDSVNLDINYAGIWVNISTSDKQPSPKDRRGTQ